MFTQRVYCHLILGLLSAFAVSLTHAQKAELNKKGKIENEAVFSSSEMDKMWGTFSEDKGWQSLMREARRKGFGRKKSEKSAWGSRGVLVNENGTREDVLFCLYEMEKKGSKESCSMIWAKQGTRMYKAYFVTPAGKEIEDSDEWYADESGAIHKAHSYSSCVKNGVKFLCLPTCGASIFGCIFVVANPAGYLACIATVCGGCALLVSIRCAFP
jgi:hypothetical protein